jgi:NADH:ubiquinone oxidoreductase subunit 2 (subunit N)
MGIVLATLSMAGFPLLAGFPVRLALLETMAPTAPLMVFWAALGSAGLLMGGFRSLAVLVMGADETPWHINESPAQILLITLACMGLILAGIAPHLLQ